MLSESEIRAIASTVVSRAKSTARVDQGTLKRSIAYTYVGGVVTFRQIYYGDYGDNSQLEKIASQLMPYGVAYKIELTALGGDVVEVGRTKKGRKTLRSVISNIKKDSSSNIKALISKVTAKKKKDGKKEE